MTRIERGGLSETSRERALARGPASIIRGRGEDASASSSASEAVSRARTRPGTSGTDRIVRTDEVRERIMRSEPASREPSSTEGSARARVVQGEREGSPAPTARREWDPVAAPETEDSSRVRTRSLPPGSWGEVRRRGEPQESDGGSGRRPEPRQYSPPPPRNDGESAAGAVRSRSRGDGESAAGTVRSRSRSEGSGSSSRPPPSERSSGGSSNGSSARPSGSSGSERQHSGGAAATHRHREK